MLAVPEAVEVITTMRVALELLDKGTLAAQQAMVLGVEVVVREQSGSIQGALVYPRI